MKQILICDDNKESLNSLSAMIKDLPGPDHEVHEFSSGAMLKDFVDKNIGGGSDCILFLDIDLGDANGIDLSKELLIDHPAMKLVFITGYVNYAGDIFESRPSDFLVKPVTREKLMRAFSNTDSNPQIAVHTRQRLFRISVQNIVYLESSGRHVLIYLTEGSTDAEQALSTGYGNPIELPGKLDDFASQPELSSFLRCHKSYLINPVAMDAYEERHLRLRGGQMIPVSRPYQAGVKEFFLNYLASQL